MSCFFDTNILVYALGNHDQTNIDQARKKSLARALLIRMASPKSIVLSAQVLGEFFNVVTRKGHPPLSQAEAAAGIDLLSKFLVIPTDLKLVHAAVARVQQSRIAYYDALIVEAAIRAGATTLYTEDMHHGARYGALELHNPFLA